MNYTAYYLLDWCSIVSTHLSMVFVANSIPKASSLIGCCLQFTQIGEIPLMWFPSLRSDNFSKPFAQEMRTFFGECWHEILRMPGFVDQLLFLASWRDSCTNWIQCVRKGLQYHSPCLETPDAMIDMLTLVDVFHCTIWIIPNYTIYYI